MLHINIVGVVTCSDNSTRRLVTCIIGPFFNSFNYHITQFHCCNVSLTMQEKTKIEQMLTILVMSCNFMSCNFMPCNFDGPSFSCPRHFQRPRWRQRIVKLYRKRPFHKHILKRSFRYWMKVWRCGDTAA